MVWDLSTTWQSEVPTFFQHVSFGSPRPNPIHLSTTDAVTVHSRVKEQKFASIKMLLMACWYSCNSWVSEISRVLTCLVCWANHCWAPPFFLSLFSLSEPGCCPLAFLKMFYVHLTLPFKVGGETELQTQMPCLAGILSPYLNSKTRVSQAKKCRVCSNGLFN